MEGEGGQRVPRTSPLQIWHITLKRPQARVRIDNENALEERERQQDENVTLVGTVHIVVRVCWIVTFANIFLPNAVGVEKQLQLCVVVFFSSPVSISTLVNKQIAVSKNRSAQPRGQVLEELWEELNVAQGPERTAHAVSQEAHRNTHTDTHKVLKHTFRLELLLVHQIYRGRHGHGRHAESGRQRFHRPCHHPQPGPSLASPEPLAPQRRASKGLVIATLQGQGEK